MPPRPLLAALVLLVVTAGSARAQEAAPDTLPPQTEAVDVRVLRAVYGVEARPFVATVQAVNDAAYPVYAGAVPVVGGVAVAAGEDLDPALRLAVAEGGAVALTYALKRLVRRPRRTVPPSGGPRGARTHLGGRRAKSRARAGPRTSPENITREHTPSTSPGMPGDWQVCAAEHYHRRGMRGYTLSSEACPND